MEPGCVFENSDCPSIYDVPAHLAEQGFDTKVCERLGLDPRESDMSGWYKFTNAMHAANKKDDVTKICVVGKYTQLPDAYLSIIEALHHCRRLLRPPRGHRSSSTARSSPSDNVEEVLGGADGILVPGGFGLRAFEGKIAAARYARDASRFPYLGICLGLQVAVCEFARNVAGMPGASSAEFDRRSCAYPVIDLMPDQEDVDRQGRHHAPGRLSLQGRGRHPARAEAYGEALVYERHRHRFEVNNAYPRPA